MPTYKEQQEALSDKDLSSVGFLGYPLLQTADVAIYDGNFIPVGEDQVAHLELSREVVRRFNRFYGDVLVEPKPLLTKVARLPGLDGFKKMSKSLGNTILLSEDADAVKKKVRSMYTEYEALRRCRFSPSRQRSSSTHAIDQRLFPTMPALIGQSAYERSRSHLGNVDTGSSTASRGTTRRAFGKVARRSVGQRIRLTLAPLLVNIVSGIDAEREAQQQEVLSLHMPFINRSTTEEQ